ncbi:MAG: hypothetical protein ACLRSW_03695 [Christensenellaceae bacterium]
MGDRLQGLRWIERHSFFLYSVGVGRQLYQCRLRVTFDFQLDETGKSITDRTWTNSRIISKNAFRYEGFISPEYAASKEYVPITDAVGGTNSDGSYKEAKYGAFTQMYIYMTQYENTAHALKNEEYSLVAVPNPKINESDEMHIRQKANRAGNYAVITDKLPEDKIDDVMKWFDYRIPRKGAF